MVRPADRGLSSDSISRLFSPLISLPAISEERTHESPCAGGALYHLSVVRTRSHSGDLGPACRKLHDEQQVERDQSTRLPKLNHEKIVCSQHRPIGLEELLQVIHLPRSGAGSLPCRFRILAIIVRPTR